MALSAFSPAPTDANHVLYVDTVADMLALTDIRDGAEVQTARYSTAHATGDGSDNKYVYSSSSSSTIDGGFVMPGVSGSLNFSGTTFNGTVGAGRWLAKNNNSYYGPHFGLRPGSGIDHTERMDAIIEWSRLAGKKFILAPGEYHRTSSLPEKQDITLIGEGAGTDGYLQCEIYFDGVPAISWLGNPTPFSALRNYIKNITFRAEDNTAVDHCIALSNTFNINFDGCTIYGEWNVNNALIDLQGTNNRIQFTRPVLWASSTNKSSIGFKFTGDDQDIVIISPDVESILNGYYYSSGGNVNIIDLYTEIPTSAPSGIEEYIGLYAENDNVGKLNIFGGKIYDLNNRGDGIVVKNMTHSRIEGVDYSTLIEHGVNYIPGIIEDKKCDVEYFAFMESDDRITLGNGHNFSTTTVALHLDAVIPDNSGGSTMTLIEKRGGNGIRLFVNSSNELKTDIQTSGGTWSVATFSNFGNTERKKITLFVDAANGVGWLQVNDSRVAVSGNTGTISTGNPFSLGAKSNNTEPATMAFRSASWWDVNNSSAATEIHLTGSSTQGTLSGNVNVTQDYVRSSASATTTDFTFANRNILKHGPLQKEDWFSLITPSRRSISDNIGNIDISQTFNFDSGNGDTKTATLTDDTAITLTATRPGMYWLLLRGDDGVTERLITWSTSVSGFPPASVTSSTYTVIQLFWDGSGWHCTI